MGTLAALVAIVCASLVFGMAASSASALTSQEKAQGIKECEEEGGSFKDCCHKWGGSYDVEYDEKGNIISEICWYSSDPSQTGPTTTHPFNVPTSHPFAIAPGAETSGTSSGGKSHAGLYGITALVHYPTEIIP
jgi:hypothetical protein